MGYAEDMGHDIYDGYFEDDGRNETHKVKFLAVARETEKAWLLTFEIAEDFSPVQAWIPKSQCDMGRDPGVIFIPQWLIEEKELEKYAEE